ncbi:MAG: hypothetical protein Ct9H90mP2_03200 [Dehalococcoidia bacterium]|nr:MAG: hypothetical protein Ct9H90mP2_03200 [Dehalococcoidia bacterium]
MAKKKNLFKVIEGKDPRETFTHWQNMIRYAFKGGDEGEVHGALSAIDIALWDFKSKINDEPLWKTLEVMILNVKYMLLI